MEIWLIIGDNVVSKDVEVGDEVAKWRSGGLVQI